MSAVAGVPSKGGYMSRTVVVALLALSLVATPLPMLISAASAESQAASDTKTETKPKKEPSAAMTAMHERLKKCGAEWKEAKAAGKIKDGMKWPQYWSACNKRLKGGT